MANIPAVRPKGFNWQKAVITGNVIQVFESTARFKAGNKTALTKLNNDKNEQQKEKEKLKNDRASKKKLIDLFNCNFELGDIHLILTFADNVQEREIALHELKKFIQRLRRKLNSFDYIAVPELQKRGAYHFHVIINPKQKLDPDEIEKLWGKGFIKLKWIDSDNIGAYISKYIGKDFNWRPEGSKAYFCSKGLQRPDVLRGEQAKHLIRELEKGLKPVYDTSFETPEGIVIFVRQFNTLRPAGGNNWQKKDKPLGG